MKFKWFFVCVILLSFISTGKSLLLSLGGDDWLALFRYEVSFSSFISHFQLSNYTGNYDAANILMGLIYRVFEYNPFPYYLISLILRVLAALSFYPMLYTLTKNKFISAAAGLLFVSAYAGIETTNWVFNMTTYLSIALFNLFLWNFISTYRNTNIANSLVQAFFVFLSFYFTPNRMHALVFIIPILEFIRIRKSIAKNILISPLRIMLFLLPISLFRFATGSEWDKGYLSMLPDLQTRGYNLLFYLISNIGSILFPDKLITLFASNLSVPDISSLGVFLSKTIGLFLFFLIITCLFSFSFKQRTKFIFQSFIGIFIFNALFWLSLQTGNINNFGNLVTFWETLIGGYTLIILSLYFYLLKKSCPDLSSVGLFSLFSTLAFLIAPWLAFTGDFPSDHRYLTVSTGTAAVTIAALCAILRKQGGKIAGGLTLGIIILYFSLNVFALHKYFDNYLSHGRKAGYVKSLFNQLISRVNPSQNDKPLIFLFLADDQFTLYNSIGFGFDTHLMLTHPFFSKNLKTLPKPIIADNKESLISILKDPNSSELKRYGHPPAQIPLENVFSFYLKEDKLLSNTDQLRKELSLMLAR